MDEYKRKRQEEMGMPIPQEDPVEDPESVDPFAKPSKGKMVAPGKLISEKGKKLKKDKKDKKAKKSKKLKGNADELVEVHAPDDPISDPALEVPVKSKKSKSKGKYDMDQYNPSEAYSPSPNVDKKDKKSKD